MSSFVRNRVAARRVARTPVSPTPPAVPLQLDSTVRDYWIARYEQHLNDSYAGVPLLKLPEDLRIYEHLLWQSRADTVIELGTNHGGSALWFRDHLRTMACYGVIRRPRVISIDLDVRHAHYRLAAVDRSYAKEITLMAGDVLDPRLPERVASALQRDRRCLVVDDSAHTYDVTQAALGGFARFVPRDGFFVVEDGYVDIEAMRNSPAQPRGVLPAITDWLTTVGGRGFTVRRDLELYGICSNPHGYLQRVA